MFGLIAVYKLLSGSELFAVNRTISMKSMFLSDAERDKIMHVFTRRIESGRRHLQFYLRGNKPQI